MLPDNVNIFTEAVLGIRVVIATGIGVYENVSVVHLVECALDEIGFPFPIAVATAVDGGVEILEEVGS